MEKKSLMPLQAISPTIDYKEFYLNYHKRKKHPLLLREKDLPQIKTNNEINNNTIAHINTIYRTNNILNLSLLTPLKTNINNSTLFPKLNTVKPRLKNFKLQLKNKKEKEGKLSMKYIDIINMNKSNKLLIYEISKTSKQDEEITKYIFDPIEKKKIFQKLDIIEKKASEEIENIINSTTRKEKEETLKFFVTHPKIIDIYAEDILKGFNNFNINKKAINNEEVKMKEINNKNIINKKEEKNNNFGVKKLYKDFIDRIKNKIMRKIELRNQCNQEISIEYIENVLKNEVEKIKLIISLYLNENQNEEILFNPEEQSNLTEKRKRKIKNMKSLDKSIKKLIKLNDCYNQLIKTGYDEENYKTSKTTKNENTQYNYKDLIKEENDINKTRNEYLNNILNENGHYKKINNMNFYREKKFNDYLNNEGIFSRFKKFCKKNETIINNLKKKNENENKDFIYNEANNEIIQRRIIYMNKKEDENNDDKINDSKNYKVIIENEKITSTSNKDILSLFDRTKYNNDKGKGDNKTEKEKIYLNNGENKNKNEMTLDAEKNNEYENINKNNENSEEDEKLNISDYEEDEDMEEENFITSKLSFNDNKIRNNSKNEIISQLLNKKSEDNNNIIINEKQKKKRKIKKIKDKNLKEKQKISKEKYDLKTLENSKSKNSDNNKSNKKMKNIPSTKEENKKMTLINNNKIKNTNILRKSKMLISQVKKILSIKKGNQMENNKKSIIKNFEVLTKDEKIFKKNFSYNDIYKIDEKRNDKNEVNIIKLHENDIDQIVEFINEEEKRKIRIEKNNERMNKEKTKNKENIINKINNIKYKEITRKDFLEKLKRDDSKTRQYIEDIIKAGLTNGNKKLSKQMKNESIIMFQGINLGAFKFKKKFGIRDEINLKPFRPISHNKKIKEEKNDEKEKIKKDNMEEIINNNSKEKEKKKEETKKKLIYDNRYLFKKKKQSIKYILRKEVEEILKGGIIIQQKVKEEEEKIMELENRYLPPKRHKFIKKKKNRKNLFRKSVFLKDMNNNSIESIKEYSSNSSSKIKEESNNSFEEKMQNFIEIIKRLKKGEELNFDDIDDLKNQRNKRSKKEKAKEKRMQGFLDDLNEYRDMNISKRKKNNNFSYKMPLLISTNADIDKNNI